MQDGRIRTGTATPGLALCALALGAMLGGCASPQLDAARSSYYAGNYVQAESHLQHIPGDKTDTVLLLMERGMIRQARADYTGSVRDWNRAEDIAEQLDYLSVSRETASLAVNDSLLPFRGEPYERVLMHAFAAQSYAAMRMWDDAAVEGRVIINKLQDLNGFPDDPYSRYLAGFMLEVQGDGEGARLQYRLAAKLLTRVKIEPDTGRLSAEGQPAPTPAAGRQPELVCFVSIGRIPSLYPSGDEPHDSSAAPYAEFYADGQLLGRSYPLASTSRLLSQTQARRAALKAAKSAARIVLKEAASQAVEAQNDFLGELLRLLLFSLEVPDTRRWETLPRWLEVARVPCPRDLKSFKVVFRQPGGRVSEERVISAPVVRSNDYILSFCRGL